MKILNALVYYLYARVYRRAILMEGNDVWLRHIGTNIQTYVVIVVYMELNLRSNDIRRKKIFLEKYRKFFHQNLTSSSFNLKY